MKLTKPLCKIIFLFVFAITIVGCDNKMNSEVMLKFFNIKTTNQFYINIPDALKEQCLINETIQIDSLYYAKGTMVNDKTGEKTTIVLDYSKTIALNNNSKNITRFVTPFVISGKGTGNFTYIGLFELNLKSNNINHSDSHYLGDRIILNNIEYDGVEKLKVTIKIHSLKQPFPEKPKKTKKLNFNITEVITPVKDNN